MISCGFLLGGRLLLVSLLQVYQNIVHRFYILGCFMALQRLGLAFRHLLLSRLVLLVLLLESNLV